MTTTINASPTNGLVQTADGSGVLKVQSNGVTTNALAWVNFAGASGTRNASYNVSSVTRTAAGSYTVTFATAQADAYYVVTMMSYTAGNTTGNVCFINSQSTSSFNVTTLTYTSASYADPTQVQFAVFGN